MITTTCPGNFCALASHLGHYYVAGKDNSRLQMVVRRLDGDAFVETHAYDMGGDSGAGFPSMVNNAQDQLWLGYIPADGLSAEVVNLTTRETRSHRIDGWKCQTWAIVLGPKGYAINWNGSLGPTQVYDYSGQLVTTIPGGAPTGLARLAPDNSAVITNDQNRPEEIEWGIYEPDYAGSVLAGEGFNGGIPLVYANQQKIVLAEGTYAYRPRVAQLGDSWAAAATGVGFRDITVYVGITAADFAVVTPQPVAPAAPAAPAAPVDAAQTITVSVPGPLRAGDSVVIRVT